MMEKYEIVAQMFHGFDYKRYFLADTKEKMTIILEAQEHYSEKNTYSEFERR